MSSPPADEAPRERPRLVLKPRDDAAAAKLAAERSAGKAVRVVCMGVVVVEQRRPMSGRQLAARAD